MKGPSEQRIFKLAAIAAALIVVAFVAVVALHLGGDRVTVVVDDIGEAMAALVAAICTGFAAKRSVGRQRVGWTLLSASAGSWCAGEIVWCVYEVGLQVDVPFPSAADVGFLGAVPLAAAGILAFFSRPRGTSTEVRLWLDGAIVFTAFLFVGWVAGLDVVYTAPNTPPLDRALSMAYPIGDILIGSILVLAIRRANSQARGRLLLLLGGLGANAVADSTFAYLNAQGTYGLLGSILDAGWVIGYLTIALAAIWPSAPLQKWADDEAVDRWQLVLPWTALFGAGVSAIIGAVLGDPMDQFLSVLAGLLTIMVMASQVYAHNESFRLLTKSRQDAKALDDIITYAPLGVVKIGTDMIPMQANPRFAELVGRANQPVLGVPVNTYLSTDAVARAKRHFESVADGSATTIDSEGETIFRDGTHSWLHWSATAVRKPDGDIDYFIAMLNDTNARHQAEVAAVANINVLERLNRLKSEFLTMVRHEFRTALVGIEGFSELMRDEEALDVPTVKGFANDIYNDARRLSEMLDKMLDIDGITGDSIETHLEPIQIDAVLLEAVARARASSARHTIRTALEAALPTVSGDAARLAQLFGILLDNAIKFSPGGGEVVVSVRTLPGKVIISVKDHGVGVPPGFDDQLFTRYQWSANNPTTKVVGTGLGLPMARQIAEMHGGRIWFDSKVGEGSEFHVALPAQTNRPVVHQLRAVDSEVA